MQGFSANDEEAVKAFRVTVSEARFARYVKAAGGDTIRAVELYHWNALLSQAMYLPLQVWEITLRNRLNNFLCWKFNSQWPNDERALRLLTANGSRRLSETKRRLEPKRSGPANSTDAIVADLSAGFWVSLFAKSYDVPFAWRYNLRRIVPHAGAPVRAEVSSTCERLLVLRNRVAHHEPILQLDLPALKADLDAMTGGMCASASAYMQTACTFDAVWRNRP